MIVYRTVKDVIDVDLNHALKCFRVKALAMLFDLLDMLPLMFSDLRLSQGFK